MLRLFLKGEKKSGKTELFLRSLNDIRLISGGYCILPLEKDEGSEEIVMLSPQEAGAAALPYSAYADNNLICPESKDFTKAVVSSYEDAKAAGFGFFDEILGKELADCECAERLLALLTDKIPVAGVIGLPENAGDLQKYNYILEMLEADENTVIIDCGRVSVEEAVGKMRDWAEENLDRANHEKFDPLMKLRGRRKK